ncbi:hypothetical protein [Halegenticoccus tardaugens]|uniref:hypothetical protein n=1 Tax=Halegenticoccus tardaugens TaxID=2071624 RepID=UPI00100AC1D2|nr:hypothetical protein [Halegenticoccus tardaugens]
MGRGNAGTTPVARRGTDGGRGGRQDRRRRGGEGETDLSPHPDRLRELVEKTSALETEVDEGTRTHLDRARERLTEYLEAHGEIDEGNGR